ALLDCVFFFFFQAEDGIRDRNVTGVQTCALPIYLHLSFNTDKPMNVFGWIDYENRIKEDWKNKVTDNDLVLLPGDFSWELKLERSEERRVGKEWRSRRWT